MFCLSIYLRVHAFLSDQRFFSNIHSILHPRCTKRLMTTTYSFILSVKNHIMQSYPNTGPKVLDPALLHL